MDQFSVSINTQQKRVKAKPVFTFVDRDYWDKTQGDGNCIIEPHYEMAMLRPRCREASWYTSTTSPYDKLGVADFTGLTSAKWSVFDKTGTGGGKYLTATESANYSETATTAATLGQNRGVVLEFFSPGEGSDFELLRFGYSNTAAYTSGIGFRLYANGRLKVYKNGTFLEEVSIYGKDKVVAGEYVELLLIPCRKREILILSNKNGTASICFNDIDTTPNEPEIVPDVSFWFQFQSSVPPCIQIAPMKFATSGTVLGDKSAFKRAPSASAAAQAFTNSVFSGITNALVMGHQVIPGAANNNVSTAVLRDGTDSGNFTPDGINTDCRIKLTLTGSGSYSPVVYGAVMGYQCETVNTANTPVSLALFTRAATLSVPEDPDRVEIALLLKKPAAIEAAGASRIRTIANLPAQAKFGSHVFMDARSCEHNWDDGESDDVRRFRMILRDPWKMFERMLIDDPIPLDGVTFSGAVQLMLSYAGFTSAEWDIESTTARIESIPNGSGWNLQIVDGDTVASWIKRLFSTYAPTWFYGIKPVDNGAGSLKTQFFAKSPTGLGTTAKLRLYPTMAAAVTAKGSAARRYVYRAFTEPVLEPEANEIYVTGRDPAQDRKIVTARRDSASIDPTTNPADRPNNWVGEVLTMGYMDTSLTTEGAIEDAADFLEDRLTTFRRLPNWSSEMLFYTGASGAQVPLWRGDVVELADVAGGSGTVTKYRVLSFDGEFQLEASDTDLLNGQLRPFSYTAEELL